MPTYEYICDDCGHEMETFQSMKADPLKDCPECAKPALRRKIGRGAGIIFKGSGFYQTDYKNSSAGSSSGGSKEKASASSGGGCSPSCGCAAHSST